MKKFLLSIFLFSSFFVFGQKKHPSTEVIETEKYNSATLWSPKDRHFGYYFLNFSMPIPIESSSIENCSRSGSFKVGYTYRFKLVKFMDIGIELAYANKYSGIKKDDLNLFEQSAFFKANKIRTFHNSIEGGFYLRFNLGGATYRKLGTYIDIGGFYDYAFNYGTLFKTKNSKVKQKTRFKKPDYLSPENYGIYFRVGWNYLSLICSYDFGSWIDTQNNEFKRSPLMIGLQLNLFAR